MVGNFAQEEIFSSPCNGLFALEGLSFSTGSLRIPRDERYGLCYGPSNNCASLNTAGRVFMPYREASLLTLATFLTLARFIESSKSAARQSRSFSTT
jgi:hypothetical protein